MKKNIFLLNIILCFSCSNGLNKPIIETLSVDELKANIKKDTTFTDFYKDLEISNAQEISYKELQEKKY